MIAVWTDLGLRVTLTYLGLSYLIDHSDNRTEVGKCARKVPVCVILVAIGKSSSLQHSDDLAATGLNTLGEFMSLMNRLTSRVDQLNYTDLSESFALLLTDTFCLSPSTQIDYFRQMRAMELASMTMELPLMGTSTTFPSGLPLAVSKFWPAQVLKFSIIVDDEIREELTVQRWSWCKEFQIA